MHYLRISLIVESDESLDSVREGLQADLEASLDGVCRVVNISHDRELASVFVQAQSARTAHEVLTQPPPPEHSADVTAVLAHYGLTLPKPRRADPAWKVVDIVGEMIGLPHLRGRVVLTNGIKAFMIVGGVDKDRWADVHWNWFMPDNLDDLPDDVEAPSRPVRQAKASAFETMVLDNL